MVNMQGLTLEQLADLYDQSPPVVKQWMLDNSKEWTKEKPPTD